MIDEATPYADFKPLRQQRVEPVEPSGTSPEALLAAHKRNYAVRLQAIRRELAADMQNMLAPQVRRRILEELDKCASAFVLKLNPWRKL